MLTDVAARRAKAQGKDYKIADAGGLYLFVSTTGHRSWRYKYRFDKRERRLVFGTYPDVSLAEARQLRDEAKRSIKAGRDPAYERKKARLTTAVSRTHTLERVARDWFELQRSRWKAVHASDVITSLERDIFPTLGPIAVTDISKPIVLAALQRIEARGAVETAHRIRQRLWKIFEYAEGLDLISSNPADVGSNLKSVPKGRRWPALTDLIEIRNLVAAVDANGSHPITRLASRFMALTAQRPGMVRGAPWAEFEEIDFANEDAPAPAALWRIPASRMKLALELGDDKAFDHIVPLGSQAVEVLRAVHRLTGRGPLTFPNNRSSTEPLSENAVGYLYNRLGYKGRHVAHGWRSSFSTVMNSHYASRYSVGTAEIVIIERFYIDLMLAHIPAGISATELLYNRAKYLDQMRQIAQLWGDWIMAGRASAHDLLDGPRRRLSHTR